MTEYTTRPLDTETWDAYARLMDKHHGAGFGCWCTWFHQRRKDRGIDAETEAGRPYKEWLVQRGEAHAAVVFEGDYEAGLESPPDYRVTCIFVDRNHRRDGVAAVALGGALDLIAQAGGGVVEGYPQDTAGKKISSSFLYNATITPPAACTRRPASPTSAPRARTTA